MLSSNILDQIQLDECLDSFIDPSLYETGNSVKTNLDTSTSITAIPSTEEPSKRTSVSLASGIKSGTDNNTYYYNRGWNDPSLSAPIRQTASIFKQPVTVYKSQESVVKHDLKYGPQEKPKQLFWEKRLESLRACDKDGTQLVTPELPENLKAVGPEVSQETLLQSLATALHVFNHPVTGQTAPCSTLEKDTSVFINPDQPLIQAVTITDDDIKKQEDRVQKARRRLQDAIQALHPKPQT